MINLHRAGGRGCRRSGTNCGDEFKTQFLLACRVYDFQKDRGRHPSSERGGAHRRLPHSTFASTARYRSLQTGHRCARGRGGSPSKQPWRRSTADRYANVHRGRHRRRGGQPETLHICAAQGLQATHLKHLMLSRWPAKRERSASSHSTRPARWGRCRSRRDLLPTRHAPRPRPANTP